MPPPSYCSKVSTRSTGDHEPEIDNDIENSKSEISNFGETTSEDGCKAKYDGVGIVKSILGPSLEDAVLRTLEFGKSLIQKTEENEPKRMLKQSKKDATGNFQKQNYDVYIEEEQSYGMKDDYPEGRVVGKRMGFEEDSDKSSIFCSKPTNAVKKLTNVSKIRSLDSDLKQVSPSPEKIKRQLEALIQIHKDGPPQRLFNWNMSSKPPKLPMEMTVMPAFCGYKNETDLNCASSCDVQSQCSRKMNDKDPCSSGQRTAKKRAGAPNKICQAPEFLSNALGPTLDVSIIDNLKMMRDIFKCDSAKGEGASSRVELPKRMGNTQGRPEVQIRLQQSEEEMAGRIEELQKKIEELEHKEECLIKQIEEEDREREMKKKAFEEEEKKLCSMKACMENMAQSSDGRGRMAMASCEFEAKYECLQQRIACEEEKLSRLKDQYECYKREICDARNKKEALKRNKSLLDAWDVIASRVCHTRLPSFSNAYNLERKNFQPNYASEDVHCCLGLTVNVNPVTSDSPRCCPSGRKSRSRSRSRCGQCQSNSEFGWCGKDPSPARCRKKHDDIPFPIQRDITCGLHQSLKICSCKQNMKMEGVTCSSDDDLMKKYAAAHSNCRRETCCYSSSMDTSAEVLLRKPPSGKPVCRSKSDTTMRNCPKIVKVLWAVTRINIFQDNCKTYEVMDATSTPPACAPARTEGIFVVKSAQKKCSQNPSKRKTNILGL